MSYYEEIGQKAACGPEPELYDSGFEHENCGIGAVVNIRGERTRKTVTDALTIVERLEHRAGKDAKGETGDGVGILVQLPHEFFVKNVRELKLPADGSFGVGMFFFPQEETARNQAKKLFEVVLEKEGLNFLGWREVPTVDSVLGKTALDCKPAIWQGFVKRPRNVKAGLEFDRRLYIARRIFEKTNRNTYVCSLSSRDYRIQGHVSRPSAAEILPGSAESRLPVGHRAGAFPLFHKYLSFLGAGASEPPDRP